MALVNALYGPIPDLPVPFEEDGSIDWFSLGRLLENCLSADVGALLVGSALLESETLSLEELRTVAEECALALGGKKPLVCAVRAFEGPRALMKAAAFKDAGASALLLEAEPCSPALLLRFARSLKNACGLPLILPLPPSLPLEGFLCAAPEGVAGLYDRGFSLHRFLDLKFSRLSPAPAVFGRGEDALAAAAPFDLHAVFSAFAACFPLAAHRVFFGRGDLKTDLTISKMLALSPLFSGREGAAALKWALSLSGLCRPFVRLPLSLPAPDLRERVAALCAAL